MYMYLYIHSTYIFHDARTDILNLIYGLGRVVTQITREEVPAQVNILRLHQESTPQDAEYEHINDRPSNMIRLRNILVTRHDLCR